MSAPAELYIDETCRDQFSYLLDKEFGENNWRLYTTRYNDYDLSQLPQVLYVPVLNEKYDDDDEDDGYKFLGLAIITNLFNVEFDEFGNRFIEPEPYRIEIKKVSKDDKVCMQCTPTQHSQTLHSPKGCVVGNCGCRLVNTDYINRKSH